MSGLKETFAKCSAALALLSVTTGCGMYEDARKFNELTRQYQKCSEDITKAQQKVSKCTKEKGVENCEPAYRREVNQCLLDKTNYIYLSEGFHCEGSSGVRFNSGDGCELK